MKNHSIRAHLLPALLLFAVPHTTAAASAAPATAAPEALQRAAQWPHWRGPFANGTAPYASPPIRWSEGENVRFKVALPGHGHSTPIVWGDRVFLTTAVPVGEPFEPVYAEAPGAHDNAPVRERHEFTALALDRGSGEILWRRTVRSAIPWQGMHRTGSYASASPVTDGEVLIAPFGSHGLYAFDLDGKLLWERDFGPMKAKHAHGEGGGPALHGETVILVWDHEGPSFIAALDRLSGEERWRAERRPSTSWSTPIVVEPDGRALIIAAGTGRLQAYDLVTGEEVWRATGLSANVVASPLAAEGMVFAGSSYEHQVLFAVVLDGARGDLTGGDKIAWIRNRGTPYVPSPLYHDGALYFHNHYQSVLSRIDASSGEDRPGPFRLSGIRNVYGSPVAAAGRVYVTDLAGTTIVLSHADAPEVLAVNRLDDRFSASAAIAGCDLFLRGERRLYRLREESCSTEEPGPYQEP